MWRRKTVRRTDAAYDRMNPDKHTQLDKSSCWNNEIAVESEKTFKLIQTTSCQVVYVYVDFSCPNTSLHSNASGLSAPTS